MALNFNQFFNLVNGTPYENIPPPVDYNFQDYAKELTNSPVNNKEDSDSWALRPLADEDMAQASAADVIDGMRKMRKAGYNPTRLGPPMTDDEFKKFTGQTW